MCGIVGYVGSREGVDVVMDGLRRLEYRGYDSAGIAIVTNGTLDCVKSPGKLKALDDKLASHPLRAPLAIGHTRWATHGAPSEANAHPHLDEKDNIAIVHNGIIENYQELRAQLIDEGVTFRSETDTETVVHLIRRYYNGDLFDAVKRTLQDIRGAYALAVVCADHPGLLVAARKGSPLIVGLGDGEAYVASDVPAIMKYTREVMYLEDGHIVALRADGYDIQDVDGSPQHLDVHTVDMDEDDAEKDGYAHFMLKEIHQQADVLRQTLAGRVEDGSDRVHLDEMALTKDDIRSCPKIIIIACGTAWHAALVGKRLIEDFARVPVEVDFASEFRYRDPIIPPGTIIIPVTQSGETADTLEALRLGRANGARVVSVVNVVGSTIARESDGVVYTHAGPEIGVASTKAYTSQLMALSLFAIWLAETRDVIAHDRAKELIAHLRAVPDMIQSCLDREEAVKEFALNYKYLAPHSSFFIGRGYNLPSAFEGALKLKEISYIHAEGYGAGEMKHGPIALVTDESPTIAIAVNSPTYEKVVSNIQEIRARNGAVLTIATDVNESIREHSDHVIYGPDCYEPFSPIVVAVPMQFFSYHIACARGCDVDQPRNLAKSVTVE